MVPQAYLDQRAAREDGSELHLFVDLRIEIVILIVLSIVKHFSITLVDDCVGVRATSDITACKVHSIDYV